ncbi:MAG: RHS repeat domain-containing protein [Bacteroidota bacterium]
MEWNSAGMLKAVRKDQTANMDPCNTAQELGDADVEYLYNVSGQRLCKIVKPHKAGGLGLEPQEKWEYYWYSYESSGIPMAIYKQTYQAQQNAGKVTFEVEEHNLFSSGRIGVRHGDELGKVWQTFTAAVNSGQFTGLSYTGSNVLPLVTHYERTYGAKQYELSNHLGNVLATVSDKRLPYAALSSAAVVDRYLPDVLSYSDYYAFGAAQPGRTGGEYRYGFNGMEMDKEAKGGAGLSYTTEFRQYDPRVGRWFSPDPIVKVFESPYAAFLNNPVLLSDPSGLDPGDGNSKDNEPEKKWGVFRRVFNVIIGARYQNEANDYASNNNISKKDIEYGPGASVITTKVTFTEPNGEEHTSTRKITFTRKGVFTVDPIYDMKSKAFMYQFSAFTHEEFRDFEASTYSVDEARLMLRNMKLTNVLEKEYQRQLFYFNARNLSNINNVRVLDGTIDPPFFPISKALKGAKLISNTARVIKITSLVKREKAIFKLAQETFEHNAALRKEANSLLSSVAKGNMNPGIRTKSLNSSISYLRGRNQSRIYFRNTKEGIEILAYSNKSNQQAVINQLLKIYK